MGQIRYLLAARRTPPGNSGRATEAEWVKVAKTAIASGTLVLATGLLAMASAATLQIGPFNYARIANAGLPPQTIVGPEPAAPHSFGSTAAAAPASAIMLIAEDPGADAWQRMLSGDPVPPGNGPIRLAALGMMPVPLTIPAITAQLMQASPPLAMLSAMRGALDWSAIVADAGLAQESLFGKATELAEAVQTAVAPPTETTAPETPSPAPPAAAKPAPDAKPAQPAPPAAAPALTTPPLPPPPVILPPPTQVTPPPPPIITPPDPTPPVDAGSGGAPTPPVSPVPEPASWIGFITGFALIGMARRRTISRSAAGTRAP